VLQADQGADLDFLVGKAAAPSCPAPTIPSPTSENNGAVVPRDNH
jgi:hypothetical protein